MGRAMFVFFRYTVGFVSTADGVVCTLAATWLRCLHVGYVLVSWACVCGVCLYAMVCIFAMDVASRDIVVTYVGGWLVIRWASEYGPCMC